MMDKLITKLAIRTLALYYINAYPGEASPGGNQSVPRRIGVNADYGVISLFDGVSTVVPTLQKKLGYPPTVIVLAEIDVSLRALVCAEFGYRPDQTWGRTKHGSASLYVKDVNAFIEGQLSMSV